MEVGCSGVYDSQNTNKSATRHKLTPVADKQTKMAVSSAIAKFSEFSLDEGESVFSLLECPVCLDVMEPPIFLCENGHNVCSKCKIRGVTACPTCRGMFIPTRNLVLEEMAKRAIRPCSNFTFGCTEKFTLEFMDAHSRVCSYRLYECMDGCTWKGRRSTLYSHFKEMHSGYLFEIKTELGLHLRYKTNPLINDYSSTYLFVKFNELFWCRSTWDCKKKKLFDVVQYIGPQKDAAKFRYEITLSTKSNSQIVKINNVTRSDVEDVQNIYSDHDCFVVDFDMLRKFCLDGTFSYKINILKNTEAINQNGKLPILGKEKDKGEEEARNVR